MADEEEREHLLSFEDGDEERTTRRRVKGSSGGSQDADRRRLRNDIPVDRSAGLLTAPGPPNVLQFTTENDYVVAVFVVAFDTKAGNVIEWRIPEDVDLEGVEFKAMASGSHTLKTDFVYFRKNNLFGLACFENMPVESRSERGARMKSVGILATSYTLLYRHMQFLENQVRFQLFHSCEVTDGTENSDRHQLELPGRYGQLTAFWEDKKGTLPRSNSAAGGRSPLSTGSSPSDILPADLKVTHPAKCFTHFMQFFGRQSLILWKFALLGKRILFFSPPPIGDVCYRVYCCCCLANHSMHQLLMSQGTKPHFYINVADIDNLESEVSYIACTTEKIFETKPRLYDIYVDNQNVTAKSPSMRDMLKVSTADQDKFEKLNNLRNHQPFNEIAEDADNEEDLFTSFFMDLNNRIFQTLIEVSQSQDRQLTSEHMKVMGLDPVGDRAFLMELVETYGIDVMLIVDNPCCPT